MLRAGLIASVTGVAVFGLGALRPPDWMAFAASAPDREAIALAMRKWAETRPAPDLQTSVGESFRAPSDGGAGAGAFALWSPLSGGVALGPPPVIIDLTPNRVCSGAAVTTTITSTTSDDGPDLCAELQDVKRSVDEERFEDARSTATSIVSLLLDGTRAQRLANTNLGIIAAAEMAARGKTAPTWESPISRAVNGETLSVTYYAGTLLRWRQARRATLPQRAIDNANLALFRLAEDDVSYYSIEDRATLRAAVLTHAALVALATKVSPCAKPSRRGKDCADRLTEVGSSFERGNQLELPDWLRHAWWLTQSAVGLVEQGCSSDELWVDQTRNRCLAVHLNAAFVASLVWEQSGSKSALLQALSWSHRVAGRIATSDPWAKSASILLTELTVVEADLERRLEFLDLFVGTAEPELSVDDPWAERFAGHRPRFFAHDRAVTLRRAWAHSACIAVGPPVSWSALDAWLAQLRSTERGGFDPPLLATCMNAPMASADLVRALEAQLRVRNKSISLTLGRVALVFSGLLGFCVLVIALRNLAQLRRLLF